MAFFLPLPPNKVSWIVARFGGAGLTGFLTNLRGRSQKFASADVSRFTSAPHGWSQRQLGHLNVGEKNAYPFLALATSATIVATSVAPVVASEYRYCLQGDDYAGAGDCGFTSYQQCQASASGRTAYCVANPYLANAAVLRIPARPRRR